LCARTNIKSVPCKQDSQRNTNTDARPHTAVTAAIQTGGKQRYQSGFWETQEGTRPRAENFMNWNIVPEGILISFEDYQVGPHSFGQPEFVVPFSHLKSAVRRDGLRRLLSANRQL
jgi:uncharacterized protein DUF3298